MLTFRLPSAILPKKIKSGNMQHLVLKTKMQKPTESKARSYKHQQTSDESFNSSTGNTRTLLFTLIWNLGLFLKYIHYLILNESHRTKGWFTSNYFKQNRICNDRHLFLPFFRISRKHSSLSSHWLATWIGRFLAICRTMLISHRKSVVLPKAIPEHPLP